MTAKYTTSFRTVRMLDFHKSVAAVILHLRSAQFIIGITMQPLCFNHGTCIHFRNALNDRKFKGMTSVHIFWLWFIQWIGNREAGHHCVSWEDRLDAVLVYFTQAWSILLLLDSLDRDLLTHFILYTYWRRVISINEFQRQMKLQRILKKCGTNIHIRHHCKKCRIFGWKNWSPNLASSP